MIVILIFKDEDLEEEGMDWDEMEEMAEEEEEENKKKKVSGKPIPKKVKK